MLLASLSLSRIHLIAVQNLTQEDRPEKRIYNAISGGLDPLEPCLHLSGQKIVVLHNPHARKRYRCHSTFSLSKLPTRSVLTKLNNKTTTTLRDGRSSETANGNSDIVQEDENFSR